MRDHESFAALREQRPEGTVTTDDVLMARITSTAPGASATTRSRGSVPYLSAGLALAVAAAAFAFGPALFGGKPGAPDVQVAYAAVRTAVARTVAAGSGTIETVTQAKWRDGRGSIDIGTVVAWNGDDISLDVRTDDEPDGKLVSALVGGVYYEATDDGFVRIEDASAPNTGRSWVDAARNDVSGDRLESVLAVLDGLTSKTLKDGSVVYSGRATAGKIAGNFRDSDGLPYISRPFMKLGDPDTEVRVSVMVGADGVVRSWTCSYTWDNADWEYTATYRDLGSTAKITAPDPADVREWDGTRG